jgi:alpha-beta hydrolase superfamily lysophospholipase
VPGKIPVLLNLVGVYSTKEELHYSFGDAVPELGYAVLIFDGPGQGYVLRKNKIPLRSDFEVVTGKALNHLADLAKAYPDLQLDVNRIVVAGASVGAYYVLRASTDLRIKGCISVGLFDTLGILAGEMDDGTRLSRRHTATVPRLLTRRFWRRQDCKQC